MNIEEAINKIKEVIYMSDGTKVDYIDINHMDLGGEVSVDVFIRAIETLLTAYEKQKDKIKKAIDFINDKNNFFEDGENWQNVLKIKEILEEN